ncbi:DUF885 family protein [Novosphingobium sp. ST904]|uniref:DUF885 family protein n=1 Tax=Novosphingobium sp. ST904 TaxID=1684385 RepID=UPI00351648A7
MPKAGGSMPSSLPTNWAPMTTIRWAGWLLSKPAVPRVRLVVDTGIHSKGWSREQAIRYFIDNTGRAEGGATSEVERYCSWPGQACAYKVGHNEWVRLREKARAALGDRFDIRGFHDTALAGGGMPLTVLERVVDDWVSTSRSSAG